MNRVKNAKRGLLFGYINTIVGIILPFFSRTVIIYKLGNEYVGLGGLFTSIISILSVTELGFGSALAYILYEPIAKGQTERIRTILLYSRKAFHIIGLIILSGGLAVTPFVKCLIKSDFPSCLNIYIIFLLYLLPTVTSYFMFSYKRILLNANQRYDIEVKIQTVTAIVQYAVQIVVIVFTKNYYLYAIVLLGTTILSNVIVDVTSKRLYPDYYCYGIIDEADRKNIIEKVKGIFASKIGSTVFNSVDNIVISAFFGLAILGKYNNYYYIVSALTGMFSIIHNTLRPIIGNFIQTETKEKCFDWMLNINLIYVILTCGATTCLITLYQDFIKVWIGADNQLGFLFVILFSGLFMVSRIASIPGLFIESAGLWWESRYVSILSATVNLVLNLILSQIIGLYGVVISSIACTVFIGLWGNIIVLFKHYFNEKGMKRQYGIYISIETIIGIISIVITVFVIGRVTANGWIGLVIKGIATVGLFAVLNVILQLPCKGNLTRIKNMVRLMAGKG